MFPGMQGFTTQIFSPLTEKAHEKITIITHKNHNKQATGAQSSFATDSGGLRLEIQSTEKKKT